MNVNAGSPNVVPEAVARTEVIVDTMRGKFLDWLRTTEGTLKGYLSTLETGRIQVCSEVQAGAADAVVAGSRMKKKRARRHVGGLSLPGEARQWPCH